MPACEYDKEIIKTAAQALTKHQVYWHDVHGWRCVCGWNYKGLISAGREHLAEEVIKVWEIEKQKIGEK